MNTLSCNFTVKASADGSFCLQKIEWKEVLNTKVTNGVTPITLSSGMATGIYMAVYTPSSGGRQQLSVLYKNNKY